jgi:DNA-binding PadR family transcriptional regulator
VVQVLGEFEQLVLMSVMRVADDAYGIPIHAELRARTGRGPTLAAVYKTLERLEDKGLLTSRLGEATRERGGRRKRFFTVTTAGQRELRASLTAIRRMAAGLDIGLETP